jgi:hypothetical protein
LSIHLVLFPLGRIVATPGALEALQTHGVPAAELLARHAALDPGDLDEHDQEVNREAVRDGGRILSSFVIAQGVKVWVITEADRSSTCILLPEDY